MPKGIEYRPLTVCARPSKPLQNIKIPSGKTRCTVLLVLFSILLVLLYSINLPSWIYGGGTGTPDWKVDGHHQDPHKSYFVNTVGCRMPSLPIVDEQIRKYIEQVEPLNCTPALIQSDSRSIWFQLTEEDVEKHYGVENASLIKCCYRAFERKSNNEEGLVGPLVCFEYGERVSVSDEFVAVICSHPEQKKSTFYRDYFAFVPLKTAVEERCEKAGNDLKAEFGGEEEQLSVMILGIDSVSRLNFHRQMPLTAEMVVERLEGVEFFGYNKVGDNTYPNLVPVLTGLKADELDNLCHPNRNSSFDLCPFIWRVFAKAGYRTFYTEDVSYMETFNFMKKGFQNQPTDYYLRNFFRQADSAIGQYKKGNARLCLGGRNPTEILLEYARKVVTAMKNRLSFSLLWAVAMTHDFLNYPSLVDNNFRGLLEHMEREGFLNSTAVILLSDHGMRWGSYRNTYQGMMEDRQPFLYFLLPKWFQLKYSSAYRNLVKNRRRLTSHLDLHETLKDLIDLSSVSPFAMKQRSLQLLESKPLPRGISLFLPIPPTRTCEDAGIAPHWCTCHDHKPLAINDTQVAIAAQYAVQSLNGMLKKYPQCSVLYLHSIVDANLGIFTVDEQFKKPTNQLSDISIRFVTKPGKGEFEATVRIDSRNRSSLTGSVSRTNLYGKQSRCVDDYRMKLYCFCVR